MIRYIIGLVCFGLFFAIIVFGLQDFGLVQNGGAGAAAGAAAGAGDGSGKNSGGPQAPDIGLQSISGESFRLLSVGAGGDEAGEGAEDGIIILNFWASWCPPCVKEFPLLVSKVTANPGKVSLVAISIDQSRGDMERFLQQFPQIQQQDAIKIVWDPKSLIAEDKFNVIFLPETFIITRTGKIVSKIKGEVLEKDLAIIDELIN